MRQMMTIADYVAAEMGHKAILITDKATGDVVHQLPCPSVKQDHFEQKVIRNHGKNGSYFELASVAAKPSTARRCPNC